MGERVKEPTQGESESPFLRPTAPGVYYPRIFRGTEMNFTLDDERVRTDCATNIRLLLDDLSGIFTVVPPEEGNLNAYGPRLRQLLFTACTEVEAEWAGILRANSYSRSRPTTKDYVKLAGPMLLGEYVLGFWDYPSFAWVKPFEGWDPTNSTVSLPWYQAYNRNKHDRERHAHDARLRYVIDAVAAALALACAQFGMSLFLPGGRYGQSVFKINGPYFRVQIDGYIPPGTGGKWIAAPSTSSRAPR